MTYPNDEIPQLVKELEGYDQVVGARTSEQGTAKVARVPAKWLIRQLASYLVETPIPDLNSGCARSAPTSPRQYLHQLPTGFSCVTTITMAFLANGYSVKYIPIEYAAAGRASRSSTGGRTRSATSPRSCGCASRTTRCGSSCRSAVILAVVGVGKMVVDWIVHDFRLATNTLLILFAAFQLLAIGLLADLVRAPLQTSAPRSTPPRCERRRTPSRRATRTTSTASSNPIERRLMATFLARLDDALPTAAPRGSSRSASAKARSPIGSRSGSPTRSSPASTCPTRSWPSTGARSGSRRASRTSARCPFPRRHASTSCSRSRCSSTCPIPARRCAS